MSLVDAVIISSRNSFVIAGVLGRQLGLLGKVVSAILQNRKHSLSADFDELTFCNYPAVYVSRDNVVS
jgi:hypothetical protein